MRDMNEIEQMFFDAYREEYRESFGEEPTGFEILTPQYVIGIYRVDFLVKGNLVVEIDGHDFHKTKEQRESDYKKERYLMRNGYKVIRFMGTEVFLNPQKCVYELMETFIGAIENGRALRKQIRDQINSGKVV